MVQISSMTAFGQGEAISEAGRVVVLIQSLNRKHLEVQVSLPGGLSPFEMEVRRKVAKLVSRGKVSVSVSWEREGRVGLKPNVALAEELKEGWEAIAEAVGVKEAFDLALIADEDLFSVEEGELPKESAMEAIELALDNLVEMKLEEGTRLSDDLQQRLRVVEGLVGKIEGIAPSVVEKHREKLKSRLSEFPEDERFVREVALFAEKVDVTEELVRFKSHIETFWTSESGKKLDFLLQEMLREANTIASKTQETGLVVEIKCELEKMREQVQNIE